MSFHLIVKIPSTSCPHDSQLIIAYFTQCQQRIQNAIIHMCYFVAQTIISRYLLQTSSQIFLRGFFLAYRKFRSKQLCKTKKKKGTWKGMKKKAFSIFISQFDFEFITFSNYFKVVPEIGVTWSTEYTHDNTNIKENISKKMTVREAL